MKCNVERKMSAERRYLATWNPKGQNTRKNLKQTVDYFRNPKPCNHPKEAKNPLDNNR